MSTFNTKDGTEIYYKDWGTGKPVLLSHGWPLDADMWEYQMEYLSSRGYRTIAFDRRGFGRSCQPWTGYDYDTFADDIAELIEHLDLRDVTLVGFSMGGGDVTRYIAKYGSERVAKLALLGSVTPFSSKPETTRKASSSPYSMASRQACSRTALSSSATSPARSTASTTARKSPKAYRRKR